MYREYTDVFYIIFVQIFNLIHKYDFFILTYAYTCQLNSLQKYNYNTVYRHKIK